MHFRLYSSNELGQALGSLTAFGLWNSLQHSDNNTMKGVEPYSYGKCTEYLENWWLLIVSSVFAFCVCRSNDHLLTPCAIYGLLPRISSISFITSSVSLGRSLMAAQLSLICSGFVAPRITVETFGFFAHQASAS